MRLPNLNALKAFDAAARHLNFRVAAEELHVTQGAVAQQVRKLEAELGNRLFRREPRGLSLTEAGRAYHRPVHRALMAIHDATQKLAPNAERLTISVPPSFAAKWLVPRLSDFETSHPGIEVRTVASEAMADFRSDGVDLAIRLSSPPFPATLEHIELAAIDLCAVCGTAYADKIGGTTGLSELAAHRLIDDSHAQWDTVFAEAGLPAAAPTARFNQTALAMDAAINNQGVALVPRLLAEADIRAGRLKVLWSDPSSRRNAYHLVWPTSRPRAHSRAKMIEWLLSQAGKAANPVAADTPK